jgi:EmrB/QacA subfamily drug resistance transporter
VQAPATSPATGERIDYTTALAPKQKMVILLGVLLTLFLAALDQTIVATAQPAIVAQFQAIDLLSWVTSAYLLASTAMVPIFGKLSDLFGRKRILMIGAGIFLLGSALCGTAPSMLALIGYRVIQGVGAAGIMSVAFAVPADLWVPAERAKISGLITSVFGIAGVVGPFLGGLLTDSISWRAVFYINVPVGIIALAFVALKMPRMASGLRQPIDWAGTVTLLAAVVPLLLAVTLDKAQYAWSSPTILGLFATAAVFTVVFLLVELRAKSPLLPLGLFRNQTFTVASLASLTFGAAFFGSILYLAMFMVGVLGVSATKAGGALMPMMVGMVAGAVISSMGAQRTGRYKPFLLVGTLVVALGLFLMSRMDVNTTLAGVTWRMVVLGIGVGPMAPLLSLAVTNAVPFAQVGAASSSRTFFQNIGQTLAVAIFGVIMSTNLTTAMEARMAPIMAALPPAFQGKFDVSQMRNNASSESGEGVPDVGAKIKGEISKAFAEQRVLLTAALKENDAAAQQKLVANPDLPAELKQAVAANLPAPAREQVLKQALAGLDAKEQELLKQGEVAGARIGLAIKQSFAASTTPIYGYAVYIALLSLVVLCFLPEIPLSRGRQATVAVGH